MIKNFHEEFAFICDKVSHWTKNCLFLTDDSMLSKLDKQDSKKAMDKLCKDMVRESFKIHAAWQGLLDILGP